MKKFEIRKDSFEGKIQVLYDSSGILEYINFGECQMSEELKRSYKRYIPVNIEALEKFKEVSGSQVIPIDIVITFEQWFTLYGLPRNRDRALKIWDKLPQTTLIEAFYNTKKYLKYCHRNADWYNKMYPDTYLRGKHYQTDWDKVKH